PLAQRAPRSLRPWLKCRREAPGRRRQPRVGSPSVPELLDDLPTPGLRDGGGDAVDWDGLLAVDAECVWHPYGALPAPMRSLPVVSAEGVRLRLADGRELIDGMASWWCAIHGYRHPALDAAVRAQLEEMAHVMFGGLTHEPAVRLAARLVELAPGALERVFFADSGSVSVEVAIKLALQYQRARGAAGRTRLMTVRGGYHGDTLGAMSVDRKSTRLNSSH